MSTRPLVTVPRPVTGVRGRYDAGVQLEWRDRTTLLPPPPSGDVHRYPLDEGGNGSFEQDALGSLFRVTGRGSFQLQWPVRPWDVVKLVGMAVRVSEPDVLRVEECRVGGGVDLWPTDRGLTTRQVRFAVDNVTQAPNQVFLELRHTRRETTEFEIDLLFAVVATSVSSGFQQTYPQTWDGLREEVDAAKAKLRVAIEARGRSEVLAELIDDFECPPIRTLAGAVARTMGYEDVSVPVPGMRLPKPGTKTGQARRINNLLVLLQQEGFPVGDLDQQVSAVLRLTGGRRLLELLRSGVGSNEPEPYLPTPLLRGDGGEAVEP